MYENKANRVSKLEQHKAIANQKKDYCGCRCHKKTLGDFMKITDEYAEKVWEILESLGRYKLPDGTWGSRADDLLERNANRPKCICKCIH